MLLIKGWCNNEFEKEPLQMEWHIGETVPNFSKVVSFSADGDELNLFARAMHISRDDQFGISYSKHRGFFRTTVVLCGNCGHTYISPHADRDHGFEVCSGKTK